MSYRIEAATKEEWAERALRAEEQLREAREFFCRAMDNTFEVISDDEYQACLAYLANLDAAK